jgi:hypothetical protein
VPSTQPYPLFFPKTAIHAEQTLLYLANFLCYKPCMIEQLYGIVHSGEHWLMSEDLKFSPSSRLISELLKLPPGTKVGIEYTPKFDRHFILNNEVKGFVPPAQRYYWQRIREICKEAGHKIIYLEDFPTYQEYAFKNLELINLMARFEQETSEEEKQKLSNSIYKLQVEKEYIHQVKRENAILALIQKHQPTVVILGRGHTDYLMFDQFNRLNSKGIKVDNYKIEDTNGLEYYEFEHLKWPILTKLNENPPLETRRDFDLKRTLLERRLKAVTEGRITCGTPNFIGTWDNYIPARGLFELYIEKELPDRITGKIEDCLGTALFNGQINENQISFSKVYLPSDSSEEAYEGIIFYSGSLSGNSYKGDFEFVFPDGRKPKYGEFAIQKFQG